MLNRKIAIILLILSVALSSCEGDVEINIPEFVAQPTSNFQVDFDSQTWVANRVEATIENGVTNMIAYRNNDQEILTITLFADQVGTYTLSPSTISGNIIYQDASGGDPFATDPMALSGRIDLDIINTDSQTITGKFFFTGVRSVQQFDQNGNPVLDGSGNPVFANEVKDFTNGIFENIVYTTTINDPDPNDENEFFANLNTVEYVETILTAVKSNAGAADIITITANRDGLNEAITLTMPATIVSGNYLLSGTTVDPTADTVARYTNNVTSQVYGADTSSETGDIALPLLRVTSHDIANRRIVGTFEFTGFEIGGMNKVQVTEGSFSLTYTE